MPSLTVRQKLTIWFAGAALSLLTLMAVGVFVVERAVLDQRAKRSLADDLAVVQTKLEREPNDLEGIHRAGLAEALAVWRGGQEAYFSLGWRQFGLPEDAPTPGLQKLHGREVRVLMSELRDGGMLAVAHDETATSAAVGTLARVLLASSPVAMLGVLVTGWAVSGRALEPVATLRKQLDRIRADRPHDRVSAGGQGDEFELLAGSLNRTLDRLQEAMDIQRRFVADASHQLRTPLTAQRLVGETALTRHGNDPAALRDVIGSMLEESDRLSQLTSALLDLARADRAVPMDAVDLFDASGEVVDRMRPLAEAKHMTLTIHGRATMANSNAEMVLRAVHGLVENSLQHCPPSTHISVRVGTHDGRPIVEVTDTGPGIAPEDRARLFEPFYRGKGTEATPGCGLGLAIVRSSVLAAGGTIELIDAPGAAFRVLLRPWEGGS